MSYTKYKCPDEAIQKKIDKLPKLNPKAKKLWVDALLSGDYKQGKDRLKEPKKAVYCCLGVAVAVAVKSGEVEGQFVNGLFYHPDVSPFERNTLCYPVNVWLGASSKARDLTVFYEGKPTTLAHLNDGVCLDFETIAGLIINQL